MAYTNDKNWFSDTYTEARRRWQASCTRHGAHIRSIQHDLCGPNHEPLFMDIARLGDRTAPRVLILSCGTHGIEGFTGSAVMSAWLDQRESAWPSNVEVVLIHAVNPWGFAHGQRVTENNVDLNRNFLDFSKPIPPNNGYDLLHPALQLETWSEQAWQRVFRDLDEFRQREGEKAFSDAFNGGQYTHADGLFFGGRRPEWSNTTLRTVLTEVMQGRREVHLVDLHTGIGPHGMPFFINFDPAGSRPRRMVESIWAQDRLNGAGSTHKAFATYQGLLIDVLPTIEPAADSSAVVIEFGTRSRPDMQRAHLALMWLRRLSGAEQKSAQADAARRHYRESFFPSETSWRQSVILEGVKACEEGLAGLSALQDSPL